MTSHFQGLNISNTQLFTAAIKNMKHKSHRELKGRQKGKEEGKKLGTGNREKNMHIKMFYIFVPNLREIYLFGIKIAFQQN